MTTHKTRTLQGPKRSAIGGWLGRFWTDQSGSLSYVALAGSLVMMVFGGVGIDMMHAELKRTKVQQTLDRAVLSAANLNNTRPPETVVADYFGAMGIADQLTNVSIGSAAGVKRVTAEGASEIKSDFLGLIGVHSLDIHGHATAENAVAPTEISLVLDISGSMGGSKLRELKAAAKKFVNTVLESGGDNSRVTVSIVPYNATVNLGPELSKRYALDLDHTYSTCASFTSDDFNHTALDPNQPLEQIAHFDPNTGARPMIERPWCSTGDTGNIIVHSADPVAINAFIDSLQAQGNTAIDLGMKWGIALLDPSAQPVVSDLVRNGLAPNSARYRPAEFSSVAQKFVVVMTDGQNTSQYDMVPWLKGAHNMSNVWVDDHGTPGTGDDMWSVRVIDNPGDANDVFYWPHRAGRWDAYQNGPYSWALDGPAPMNNGVVDMSVATGHQGNGAINCSSYSGAGVNSGKTTLVENLLSTDPAYAELMNSANDAPDPADCTNAAPVQLSWQQLFGTIKTRTYARYWYWQAYMDGRVSYYDYRNAYNTWAVTVNGSTADSNLHRICSAARDQGMVIYAIGVEAPSAGLNAMRDCASSAAHFFDVSSNDLVNTFSSISDMLVELRLTE